MSEPSTPDPVLLFFAVTAAPDGPLDDLKQRLPLEFGPLRAELPLFPFDQTNYYEKEMGPGLSKTFLFYGDPMEREDLLLAKLHSYRLEKHFSRSGGNGASPRTLNIDPGFLDLSRVSLSTGKDRAHRVYVGKGIFVEVTLVFRKGEGYQPLPWTYPDYQRAETLEFFNGARQVFRELRKDKS